MNTKEMYEILKVMHDNTDWNNLNSVKEYNRVARELRKMLSYEEDARTVAKEHMKSLNRRVWV